MASSRSAWDSFAASGAKMPARNFAVPAGDVWSGDHRFEASFYGSAEHRFVKAMELSGFDLPAIGGHADIFQPPIFKRCYVGDATSGIPYLTGIGLYEAMPRPDVFLSKTRTPELDVLKVRAGQILITDSGTVGRTIMSGAAIDGWAVTNNALRISAKGGVLTTEYLYAFFISQLGQYLLTRSQYGSVIQHIEPSHVRGLPIPHLPVALRSEITALIKKACQLRDHATRLISQLDDDVMRSCYLPPLSTFGQRRFRRRRASENAFLVRSRDRFPLAQNFGESRLDATFHDPVAIGVAKFIRAQEGGGSLRDVVAEVRNSALRKRVYVDDVTTGVPMIGGRKLMQIRPADVKYLSRTLTRHLTNEVVKEGWTLVTCGGSLGDTLFVHRNLEEWCMSQDIMRVIPAPDRALPGFIFAFLRSPYGQVQLHQRGYGSVVIRLRDFQFGSIAIRVPKDRGDSIHHKVLEAFDARADARQCEDSAVTLFMDALKRGRQYVESEWGREY